MSVNVDVSEVQEQVEELVPDQEQAKEGAKKARRLVRKMALATLGVAGLTYDAGKSIVNCAGEYVHKAEERGEEIENAINARANQVQTQLTEEAKARRAQMQGAVGSVSDSVGGTKEAFQNKLSSLKISNDTVIETDQIKIEVEVIDKEPWEGYDDLNAQEIIDHLSSLGMQQLQEAYAYESNTKNRVTVLREIEMLQAAIDEETVADDASTASAAES